MGVYQYSSVCVCGGVLSLAVNQQAEVVSKEPFAHVYRASAHDGPTQRMT